MFYQSSILEAKTSHIDESNNKYQSQWFTHHNQYFVKKSDWKKKSQVLVHFHYNVMS